MRVAKKIMLYVGALLHAPWTCLRVVVSVILIVDLWCDKVINGWLAGVEKEIEEESNN